MRYKMSSPRRLVKLSHSKKNNPADYTPCTFPFCRRKDHRRNGSISPRQWSTKPQGQHSRLLVGPCESPQSRPSNIGRQHAGNCKVLRSEYSRNSKTFLNLVWPEKPGTHIVQRPA